MCRPPRVAYVCLVVLGVVTSEPSLKGFAPTAEECKAVDPLTWCSLRVGNSSAKLEHMRTCADIALIDGLQEAITVGAGSMDVATPLRKSIWRGFEDHVCIVRNREVVVEVY